MQKKQENRKKEKMIQKKEIRKAKRGREGTGKTLPTGKQGKQGKGKREKRGQKDISIGKQKLQRQFIGKGKTLNWGQNREGQLRTTKGEKGKMGNQVPLGQLDNPTGTIHDFTYTRELGVRVVTVVTVVFIFFLG